MAPCGVALRQWHRTESAGKAHWPPAFRMEVSQSSEAAGCAIEHYCVGVCVVCVFFFLRLLINRYNTSWPCVAGSYSVFPGDCLLFK